MNDTQTRFMQNMQNNRPQMNIGGHRNTNLSNNPGSGSSGDGVF